MAALVAAATETTTRNMALELLRSWVGSKSYGGGAGFSRSRGPSLWRALTVALPRQHRGTVCRAGR